MSGIKKGMAGRYKGINGYQRLPKYYLPKNERLKHQFASLA
jgi:hypothetical protein